MKESKSNQAPAWFIEFENNLNNSLDKRFEKIDKKIDDFKDEFDEFKDNLDTRLNKIDLKLDLILDCPTIKKEIDHSKLNKLA